MSFTVRIKESPAVQPVTLSLKCCGSVYVNDPEAYRGVRDVPPLRQLKNRQISCKNVLIPLLHQCVNSNDHNHFEKK